MTRVTTKAITHSNEFAEIVGQSSYQSVIARPLPRQRQSYTIAVRLT